MLKTICTTIGAGNFMCHAEDSTFEQVETKFLEHMSSHGLSFGTTEEYKFRFEIFSITDAKIAQMNSDPENTFVTGHNKFSTMTADERKAYRGKLMTTYDDELVAEELPTADLASSVDWRKKGAVNPVQDQGNCGSCWAFSSVAAIEGEHFIKTGTLLKLSEQQLVDCDPKSSGCDGGLEIYAFKYAETHPIELETAYPYKGRDKTCKATKSKGKVDVTSYKHVPKKSVAQLKAAVAQQPTCISIDAEGSAFGNYQSGIFNPRHCGTNLDHAVTAVGYGVENGTEFLIVRNSWTADWGENGYIRISLEKTGAGVCGILLDSNRPTTD